MKCKDCGNDTVIKVGMADGVPFFSCYTEDCINYAHLLVLTADFDFVRHDVLLKKLISVVDDVGNREKGENGQDNTGKD